MKKLSKIKLNHLNDDELKNREMNNLRGGERVCGCGCNYEDKQGSTTLYNGLANIAVGDNGGHSPGGSKACYKPGNGPGNATSALSAEGWG